MTEQQRQKVTNLYIDLEVTMQDYRKAIIWLTQGNHDGKNEPSIKDTLQALNNLKEKISATLEDIKTHTQEFKN